MSQKTPTWRRRRRSRPTFVNTITLLLLQNCNAECNKGAKKNNVLSWLLCMPFCAKSQKYFTSKDNWYTPRTVLQFTLGSYLLFSLSNWQLLPQGCLIRVNSFVLWLLVLKGCATTQMPNCCGRNLLCFTEIFITQPITFLLSKLVYYYSNKNALKMPILCKNILLQHRCILKYYIATTVSGCATLALNFIKFELHRMALYDKFPRIE
jgi:hypothetical protein